jgi:hypothetical protein
MMRSPKPNGHANSDDESPPNILADEVEISCGEGAEAMPPAGSSKLSGPVYVLAQPPTPTAPARTASDEIRKWIVAVGALAALFFAVWSYSTGRGADSQLINDRLKALESAQTAAHEPITVVVKLENDTGTKASIHRDRADDTVIVPAQPRTRQQSYAGGDGPGQATPNR